MSSKPVTSEQEAEKKKMLKELRKQAKELRSKNPSAVLSRASVEELQMEIQRHQLLEEALKRKEAKEIIDNARREAKAKLLPLNPVASDTKVSDKASDKKPKTSELAVKAIVSEPKPSEEAREAKDSGTREAKAKPMSAEKKKEFADRMKASREKASGIREAKLNPVAVNKKPDAVSGHRY